MPWLFIDQRIIRNIGPDDYITALFITLHNTNCDKLRTAPTKCTQKKKKGSEYRFTEPEAKCSEPLSQVALLKMEVRQVFPRDLTHVVAIERDGQNVSKAVSCLIFMENYIIDPNKSQSRA